jgi:hypothetical protein
MRSLIAKCGARIGVLLAAVLVASAATPTAAEGSAPTMLGLDVEPDAHVYVRGPDGPKLAGLCTGGTGACNLRLRAGAYLIAAGFDHRHLADAPGVLLLRPGEDANLRVFVRPNQWADRLMGAAILVVGASLATFIVAYADQGFPVSPRRTPTVIGSFVGLGVGTATGITAAYYAERPVVEVRPSSIQ